MQALHTSSSIKPTIENYKNLEKFFEEVRKRLNSDELQPTPQDIRQILQMLNTQVYIESNGNLRIENNFGLNEVYRLQN